MRGAAGHDACAIPTLARYRMTAIASEHAPIDHKQVLVVFSGLVLAMLLAALDSTIVSTALPTIVGELGGLAHLSWVVTASPRADSPDPAVREARRPVWPKGSDAGRDRPVPRRLGTLWLEPEHDAADHLPRGAGTRRGRSRGHHTSGWPPQRCASRAREI